MKTLSHLLYLLILAALNLASTSSFARPDSGADIQRNGPRIERGERVNWGPTERRTPGPAERVFKAIADSPVRPTVKDGQLAIQVRKSFL